VCFRCLLRVLVFFFFFFSAYSPALPVLSTVPGSGVLLSHEGNLPHRRAIAVFVPCSGKYVFSSRPGDRPSACRCQGFTGAPGAGERCRGLQLVTLCHHGRHCFFFFSRRCHHCHHRFYVIVVGVVFIIIVVVIPDQVQSAFYSSLSIYQHPGRVADGIAIMAFRLCVCVCVCVCVRVCACVCVCARLCPVMCQ
jgi:hypothetical protein